MNTIARNFRNTLVAALRERQPSTPELAEFIAELKAIDFASPVERPAVSLPPTVTEYLKSALERLDVNEELAAAVRSLADVVGWYQIFQGDGIEPTLAKGLVAGQMAGQVGLAPSASIRTGLFLLAPRLHYPLHQHGALEFYFVVSGKLTVQHGTSGEPFSILPGQLSVTPCNRVHALTVGDEPCLLIYAWIGAVEAPNWWWETDAEGGWQRVCWERQPDARWLRTNTEAVSQEVFEEAGEI